MAAGIILEPGTLWPRLLDRTVRALKTGALQPIPTEHELVEHCGIRFLVRVLANLERKDEDKTNRAEQKRKTGKDFNPFLPYEENLFVAELSETHLCLLNKFNVVEHHLLIVTRQYEDQENLLTRQDFEALLAGLAEYEGLAFYNGGVIAGASQRHKHLQLVPLPLVPGGAGTPIDPVLSTAEFRNNAGGECTGTIPAFPFVHAFARLDPDWTRFPSDAAGEALALYMTMLRAAGLQACSAGAWRDEADPGRSAAGNGNAPLRQSGPYNLLATREWMLLVPREREFYEGISLNSLGFAGALLVRNAQQMAMLRKRGPMAALESTAVRRP